MVPVYGIAIISGLLLAVPFIVGFGPRPPRAVAGFVLGFGLAGMSASFAGWHAALAALAALGGGVGIAAGALVLDPASSSEGAR